MSHHFYSFPITKDRIYVRIVKSIFNARGQDCA